MQDPADRAYNKIASNNGNVKYAQLRNGTVVELNPLGPCFGGQIFPMASNLAPMNVNIVSAWLDDNRKALWRRPPQPPQAKPKSVLPPPPPRKSNVSEDHEIYTKITEGKATVEDFNRLIQESTPESVRDRVRRRMKTNATDSHQDTEGHQQLDLPDLNKRVQPKRKPAGRSQMNGRGRLAHRHSARTQEKTMPKRFAEAVEFIRTHIGEDHYEDALQLVEDKRSLQRVATRMMALPHVNREWLSNLLAKFSI